MNNMFHDRPNKQKLVWQSLQRYVLLLTFQTTVINKYLYDLISVFTLQNNTVDE